jgi:hypothetical protein
METNIDLSVFYYAVAGFLAVGIFAAIYKDKINQLMQAIEEKSNGKVV